jgi:WhiB family redox-sensing transcriptional regulator
MTAQPAPTRRGPPFGQYQPPFMFTPQPWANRALCREIGHDLFYPELGESVREAKKICRHCPVTAECLAYALDTHERFGVWGNTTERERRELRGVNACPDCGDAFTWPANRDRHIVLRHNPANPHVCTVCGQTFQFPGPLLRHVDARHQTSPIEVAI